METNQGIFTSNLGGRSSLDDGNGTASPPAEDETVVEPEQGNGQYTELAYHVAMPRASSSRIAPDREKQNADFIWCCVVLSHIISQLRPGADLSRVVLPTFILEPRSMLERITKYVYLGYTSDRGGKCGTWRI